MLYLKNTWGNGLIGFISLLFFSTNPAFAQKNSLPQICGLVYGECNDNCFKDELQELNWNKDTLLLIFSTENQCDSKYSATVLMANADTLSVEVRPYVKGFSGSKKSIPDKRFSNLCLCYYRYELKVCKIKSRPKVIVINDRPHYVMMSQLQNNHINFKDYYKNQSSRLTYKNLNTLLGKKYESPELKKVFDELGNDSVPEAIEENARIVNFTEDKIYFVFSKENTLISIWIYKGFEGKIIDNLKYADKRANWLKQLGKPTREKEITYDGESNGHKIKKPGGYKYYFEKYKLSINFDETDKVSDLFFSLKQQPND